MIKLIQIVFFGSLIAAIALFGACYLNPYEAGTQRGIGSADAILEKTYSQVSTFVRGIVRAAPARLHMSSIGTGWGDTFGCSIHA